jgi:hypothetical protein
MGLALNLARAATDAASARRQAGKDKEAGRFIECSVQAGTCYRCLPASGRLAADSAAR